MARRVGQRGREAYFARVRAALAQNGRVAIVELNEDGMHGIFFGSHSTPPEIITAEMKQAGYDPVERFDYLSMQSFLVFERASIPADE